MDIGTFWTRTKVFKHRKKVFLFLFIIFVTGSLRSFVANYRKPPNIISIIIDALRADHLGCYGYQRETSPNIDKLADKGVRFTRAIAQSSKTPESVPSIFTSTYPHWHEMTHFTDPMPGKLKTIGQILNENGYVCGLISNLPVLSLMDIKQGLNFIKISQERYGSSAEELVEIAEHFIREHFNKKPYFLYIHFFGTHRPYFSPSPYQEKFMEDNFMSEPKHVPICPKGGEGSKIGCIATDSDITDCNYYIAKYDGALAYVDAQIGRLIKRLKEMKYDKNTIIVVTSDHGEVMGEQNYYFDHGDGFVCEAAIRVPLIIWYPAFLPEGTVIDRQVEHIDLVPTLLDILDFEKGKYMQGENLLPLVTKGDNYRRIVFDKPEYAFSRESSGHSVITPGWQLIYNVFKGYMFFNLKADTMQLHDLLDGELDDETKKVFHHLKIALEKWMEDGKEVHATLWNSIEKQKPRLTDEEVKMLRSLGYIN